MWNVEWQGCQYGYNGKGILKVIQGSLDITCNQLEINKKHVFQKE